MSLHEEAFTMGSKTPLRAPMKYPHGFSRENRGNSRHPDHVHTSVEQDLPWIHQESQPNEGGEREKTRNTGRVYHSIPGIVNRCPDQVK